ncbi:MAG: PaaI family thioesterase [Phenylobacterium sp.]
MAEDISLSPVPADPAGVAALIQSRLSAAAGEGARPVSLSLDFGPACGVAREGRLEAWIDRQTRSLAFVRARLAAADGRMVAAASAVFARPPGKLRGDGGAIPDGGG